MATPRLNIAEITESQSKKYLTHNQALQQADAFMMPVIVDRHLTAPPAASNGACYIPAATATGAWAGKEKYIAQYYASAWTFYTPIEGMRVWAADEDLWFRYDGSAWVLDQNVWGELYVFNNSTAQTLTTQSTWYRINPTYTSGQSLQVTNDTSNKRITTLYAGTYEVEFSMNFTATDTSALEFSVYKNVTLSTDAVTGGTKQDNIHNELVATTATHHISCGGLVSCAANDHLTLVVRCTSAASASFTAKHINFSVKRVG